MSGYFKSILGVLALALVGCGGSVIPPNPIKEMVTEFESKAKYTITLQNMDLQDDEFKHKYKVFEVLNNQTVQVQETDWRAVDGNFFFLHEDDLGMELISKMEDGRYNNLVTPPGFSHFIGNETYGEWQGNSTDALKSWHFKPEYNHLDDDLGIKGLDVTKGEYERYKAVYRNNRPFYGEVKNDSTKYGTRSYFWIHSRPLFYSRRSLKRNFRTTTRSGSRGNYRGGGGFGK